MSYCQYCGNENNEPPTEQEQILRDQVEIARINAEKEITLAKLSARMGDRELETTETVAEIQAETEEITSVAEAEIIAAGLEAGQEPAPEPTPVVIQDQEQAEPEPELPERESKIPTHHESSKNYFGF